MALPILSTSFQPSLIASRLAKHRSARASTQRPASAAPPPRRPQSARITRPLCADPPPPQATVAIDPAPPVRFFSGGRAGPPRSPMQGSSPSPPPPPPAPPGSGAGGGAGLRLHAAGVEAVAGLTHELEEAAVLQVRAGLTRDWRVRLE